MTDTMTDSMTDSMTARAGDTTPADAGATRHAVLPTAVGELTVVARADAVTGVYFPHHWTRPDPQRVGERVDVASDPLLAATAVELDEYLGGARRAFTVATAAGAAPGVGAFAARVWQLIAAIPYGETRSYGELAAALGDPRAAREVGAATGRNPLSILVPCHRVVGRDGSLVGYAGGLARKRLLLDLEARVAGTAGTLF